MIAEAILVWRPLFPQLSVDSGRRLGSLAHHPITHPCTSMLYSVPGSSFICSTVMRFCYIALQWMTSGNGRPHFTVAVANLNSPSHIQCLFFLYSLYLYISLVAVFSPLAKLKHWCEREIQRIQIRHTQTFSVAPKAEIKWRRRRTSWHLFPLAVTHASNRIGKLNFKRGATYWPHIYKQAFQLGKRDAFASGLI